MEKTMSKQELLHAISCVSFVMDDLRLFLNTNPDNAEAIAHFNEMQHKREHLLRDYTEQFGGLTSYSCNENATAWMWNNCPMPWEGV